MIFVQYHKELRDFRPSGDFTGFRGCCAMAGRPVVADSERVDWLSAPSDELAFAVVLLSKDGCSKGSVMVRVLDVEP